VWRALGRRRRAVHAHHVRGLALAPAAHGAVIVTGVTAVVTTALAWLWFGVRPWPARMAGLVLVVIGLALVGSPGVGGGATRGSATRCSSWPACCSRSSRWGTSLASRSVAGDGGGVGAGAAVRADLRGGGGPRVLEAPRGEVVFQALFQGLGVAIAALALYAWAIRVLGDARAALFMPLVPVFGVLLGVVVLDEVPAAVQVVGIAASRSAWRWPPVAPSRSSSPGVLRVLHDGELALSAKVLCGRSHTARSAA